MKIEINLTKDQEKSFKEIHSTKDIKVSIQNYLNSIAESHEIQKLNEEFNNKPLSKKKQLLKKP